MVVWRQHHTTTLLLDGRVLVAGGEDQDGRPLASVEIYDPAAARWMLSGSLKVARHDHTATVLTDGRVLVTGGSNCRSNCGPSDILASAELYDPSTGRWSLTQPMAFVRRDHAAARLPDGRVLVIGGNGFVAGMAAGGRLGQTLSSVEAFDPVAERWTAMPPLHLGRYQATPLLLPDGCSS